MPRASTRIPLDFWALERRVQAGENLKEIAASIGLEHKTLAGLRRRMGYPPAPRRGLRPGTAVRQRKPVDLGWVEACLRCGQTMSQVADIWGLTVSGLEEKRRRHRSELGLSDARRWNRRGEKNPAARRARSADPLRRGGRKLDKHGYVLVRLPEHPHSRSGYVREHRLVMEEVLGRYLRPEEVVHHEDGDRQNNSPENLRLFATNADHLRHHGRYGWPAPQGRAVPGARRAREGVGSRTA